MISDIFFLILWLVIAFAFNGVSAWHDWAIGVVTGGFAVSIFYRVVLKTPKLRKYFEGER